MCVLSRTFSWSRLSDYATLRPCNFWAKPTGLGEWAKPTRRWSSQLSQSSSPTKCIFDQKLTFPKFAQEFENKVRFCLQCPESGQKWLFCDVGSIPAACNGRSPLNTRETSSGATGITHVIQITPVRRKKFFRRRKSLLRKKFFLAIKVLPSQKSASYVSNFCSRKNVFLEKKMLSKQVIFLEEILVSLRKKGFLSKKFFLKKVFLHMKKNMFSTR